MQLITDKNFPNERDLYGVRDFHLVNCTFDGAEDGESALKEARNVSLESCYMNLRYPLWHDVGVDLLNVMMSVNCRAALWYSRNVKINKSNLLGIKAVRECDNVDINETKIVSPEFGWKSRGVSLSDCEVNSEYLFLMAANIRLNKVNFRGKYSFQYVKDVTIEDSLLDTKDAFWHADNVTIVNSVVKGEYLAWYSRNLTFVNCKIIGTQPLCYCKNLKLINCTMENTDLSFEYSDVRAEIIGKIISVKNPRSGSIVADGIDEIIFTDDSKYKCDCVVTLR